MNTLVKELSKACIEFPLKEKWVICPSLRAGSQWLDSAACHAGHILNTEPKTFRGAVLDIAGPLMAKQGLKLVSSLEGKCIVDFLWQGLRKSGSGYLSRLEPGFSLAGALFRTVSDIRLAGLGPDDLSADAFEVPLKRDEIADLLDLYEKELAAQKLADYAEAVRISIRLVKQQGLDENVCILLPEPCTEAYTELERRLISAVPADRLIMLACDRPGNESPDNDSVTDARLLSCIMDPSDAPPPKHDGTAGIFRAVGSVNEVREVLRRCLQSGIPFDDAEVLYTDTDVHVPLIYEEMQALFARDDSLYPGAVPVTFAEGIPVRYSHPERALAAWIEWIEEDFSVAVFRKMLQDGLISVPQDGDRAFSFRELADLTRELSIQQGREGYIPELKRCIRAQRNRARTPEETDDPDEEQDRIAHAERSVQGYEALLSAVESLLNTAPERTARSRDMLESAAAFLKNHARGTGEFDELARQKLIEDINEAVRISSRYSGKLSIHFREWLEDLCAHAAAGGLGTRPGYLYAAHVSSGGHSGRGHTFIIGLDDSRFPPGTGQDPFMLDTERRRVRKSLPTAEQRRMLREKEFAAMLAALRSTVTLSYSCRDLYEDRELFPSSALIQAYRILSGDRDGDQRSFFEWEGLPVPASFSPDPFSGALDISEWWTGRLSGGPIHADRTEEVLGCYPHLMQGFGALRSRDGSVFTEYDGNVPEAGKDHDPALPGGSIISSTRLQWMGECPLRYFFRYALGMELPEEFKKDPDRWLDPLQKGSLLHSVFREFMQTLLDEKRLPVFEKDLGLIMKILRRHVEEYRERCPETREELVEEDVRDMNTACRIFLAREEDFCSTSTPLFLEAALGMKQDGCGTDLDSEDPVPVVLPDGSTVRARGKLDRIDRESSGKGTEFSIWDYKTGSASRYKKKGFGQGRLIQHVLYIHMAETRLKECFGPDAEVKRFGFFFPGPSGEGKRITFDPEEIRDEGLKIIQSLCAAIRTGAFIATDSAKDCEYCDFRYICRNCEAAAQRSFLKAENRGNRELEPFRRVRAYE